MIPAELPPGLGVGDGRAGSSRLLLSPREEGYQHVLLGLFRLLRSAEEVGTQAHLPLEAFDLFLVPLRACLAQEGSLMLGERDGYLYLNGVRAHIDLEVFPALKYLVQSFHSRNLSGILFESGINPEELDRFVHLFLEYEQSDQEFDVECGLKSIHPVRREDDRERQAGPYRIDPGTVYAARKTWFKNILIVKHLLLGRSSSCPVDADEAMQILQDLAQVILSEEAFLLALDELEDWDSRLFSHSVDVALISVLLGRRMGLDQEQLNELGVAALFHDIGFVDLYPSREGRQERFQREELEGLDEHQSSSFRRLARHAVDSRLVMRASLVAYRHHEQGSQLPYPSLEEEGHRALLTALVEIVDAYDLLLKGDDQSGMPRSPREALEELTPRFQDIHSDLLAILSETVDPMSA